jgi:16S rRNA C1402 N4-methylase RsmH
LRKRCGLAQPARPSARLRLKDVRAFVDATFGDDLHAKRVLSLVTSTAGVLHAASLAVHA